MEFIEKRIELLKKKLDNEAPEVKALNEPAYRFAIRELENIKSQFDKVCDSVSQERLTRYIVCTAHHFCHQQYGEDFARDMLLEAAIKMKNPNDARVVESLGADYVETVRRLTNIN
ncbi:TPA: hypothetical protein ACMDRZ_003195 [Vibrio cholerae]|uniref:hypothetical protein n=1 Tax=Vibrio cholerae TaxID=666 RepID=UPI0015827C7A|nr:hypothetical protein [Vibrio cholerae]QKU65587.1 hypothetical protein HPY17_19910 [Vibrio cholerae]